jgi:hypothetical protein
MNVAITDPTYAPARDPGPFDRLAIKLINDPRDVPFVRLIVTLACLVLPFAVLFFWPGQFRWWLAVPYLGLLLYFVGPFILMLHNTSHTRLFKRKYAVLNYVVPWLLGPFFGETPETYLAHHVGMHHPENNLADDLSSTMKYQRDSVFGFAHYLGSFMLVGLFDLSGYFAKRKRWALFKRMLVGELSYYAIVIGAFVVDWRAAIVVFVVPFVFTRSAMMAGNWAQHAFIDRNAPESAYGNSITCINTGYNRRCFNDGYHIGHHIKQTRHWTEMPADFDANRASYEKNGAVIFAGLDFFAVWVLLMLKRYTFLAKRVVQLGEERPIEEIEAMLRERVRPFESSRA